MKCETMNCSSKWGFKLRHETHFPPPQDCFNFLKQFVHFALGRKSSEFLSPSMLTRKHLSWFRDDEKTRSDTFRNPNSRNIHHKNNNMLFTDTFPWLELSIFPCILRNRETNSEKHTNFVRHFCACYVFFQYNFSWWKISITILFVFISLSLARLSTFT